MNQKKPGRGAALAGAVCGAVSILFLPFEGTVFLSLFLGLEGLMLTVKAGKAGFHGWVCTIGLVLSLAGALLGGVLLTAQALLAGILHLMFTS